MNSGAARRQAPGLVAGRLIGAVVMAVLGGGASRTGAQAAAPEGAAPGVHRVYTHLMDPREHPDYDRRHVRPPSWDTFKNLTQFLSLRGFAIENDLLVGYADEIEKYTRKLDLGDVLWPSYPTVFAKNLGDLADEIKRRDLYLFDIWGYVPGSGPGGYWQQYKPAPEALALLESKLGDRWLGMDVGEQDGRYIGGYASQMDPMSDDRVAQYLYFQRHFQTMGDELGNRLSTLVSLNFGHYLLKEGVYATIGAETAQGLPNGQVYYAFIRGAGKQYGVPWFGNASVFNRWGYKTYGAEGPDHGPTKGSSLNLLKRLLYNHVLYNCVFVGFESSWLDGENLSPIGTIQQAAQRWVRERGQPGAMHTPVALLLGYYSGWTFPRHLYTGNVYRVWGNIPYEAGDYLTDGVLDMLYPGYRDASYFHDESGFITPTPYGDVADCLLDDAPLWLLERYPVLVVAGELRGGAEVRDKLEAYAAAGGHLVITADNVAGLPGGIAGISSAGGPVRFAAGAAVEGVAEIHPFDLLPLTQKGDARVIARCGDMPAVVEAPLGRGRVTVLASPFGIGSAPGLTGAIPSNVDAPFPTPYPLLNHVRAALDGVFRSQMLFEAGEGLSLITCRKGPGEYTLEICNNALQQRPFRIVSHCGAIESVTELPLDQSEKGAVGYLPGGCENAAVGASGDATIAGGDVRVFAVRVQEQNVQEIPHAAPPPRPRGRALPLRGYRPIKEEVLRRPTFFDHFDGVCVDWKYVQERDAKALGAEAGWIARQGLRVFVDFTSGINLYPDLRLVNNSEPDYAASMAVIGDVLAKMPALGSKDVILSLHRGPETNFTGEQTWASFETALREIAAKAGASSIALHLRTSAKDGRGLADMVQLVERVGAPNLTIAPSVALLLHHDDDAKAVADAVRDKVGLWLLSAPACDGVGALWNTNAPIAARAEDPRCAALLALAFSAPVLFDAAYPSPEEEYADARAVERLASGRP